MRNYIRGIYKEIFLAAALCSAEFMSSKTWEGFWVLGG